ncbi:MAG: methyl-accepting chemotaxis protein [Pseudomonadota bacterium]
MLSTIKSKLIFSFTLTIIFTLIAGIYSVINIELLGNLTSKMYEHPLTVTKASLLADVNIIKMHRSMKDVALAKDAAGISTARAKVSNYEKEVYNQFAIVEDRILGVEGEKLIADTIIVFRNWKTIRDEVINFMAQGEREKAANITREKGAKHVAKLDNLMDQLVDYASIKGTGFYNKANKTSRNTLVMMMVIVGLALLANLIIGSLLIPSIIRPINQLRRTTEEVEKTSDLTQRVEVVSKDEIGAASLAFNSMLEKFESLINQVNQTSQSISTTSNQVGSVARKSVENMLAQQEETQQISHAMDSMVESVKNVTQYATEASDAANQGKKLTEESKVIVLETSEAIAQLSNEVENASTVIHGLEADSEAIGSVVDVIKGIAEQTNLLALNAAIEAARAGEQGRGFAVVADEVRTLAGRTQESTEEIQNMIERLQKGSKNAVNVMEKGSEQAKIGVEQTKKTTEALDAIAESVSIINNMNQEISNSTAEQNSVTGQMKTNVNSITNMTNETTIGAEQTSSSTEQMSQLINKLQNIVGQFKISG